MTQLAAISALRTLEGLAETQASRSARPMRTQTDAADPTARGPAVINEVEDIRKRFSREEIASVSIALGAMPSASTPEMRKETVDWALASIAAGREKGEDMVLIVVSSKNDGAMASVMSRSQLKAAIDSDDPASMGYSIGSDGKTRYVRDMLREVIGLNEALSGSLNAPVVEGIVKELRSYNPRPELDEIRNLKLDDKKDDAALLFKKDGASVSVTFFDAKPPPASASYGPPGTRA